MLVSIYCITCTVVDCPYMVNLRWGECDGESRCNAKYGLAVWFGIVDHG